MGQRDEGRSLLQALVRMAVPVAKQADRECVRTGPGAKPTVPEWFMGVLIMVAVLRRKRTKSAQFTFVEAHRGLICEAAGCEEFPSRSTYFRRYRRAHRLFRKAIKLQGERAVREGVADPEVVAVDKSLVAAPGPPWHQRDRRRGRVRRGVDREAAWGRSEHDGWVYGYGYEVVVSCRGSVVFPLLASADVASASEARTFLEKVDDLPQGTLYVLGDASYDSNAIGERIEFDGDRRTGRRLLCRQNPRNNRRPRTRPCHADEDRARSRARRAGRARFLERRGKTLYRLRGRTVEPFNSWLKSTFELEHRAWHRGLDNNRTQLLASIFGHQLLVRYNHRRGETNGRVKRLLDRL